MGSIRATREHPTFQMTLFGTPGVLIHGVPMERLRSRKEEWLLALLVLRGGKEVSRDWLSATLWPDNLPEQSLAYLRQTLYHLKKALRDEAWRLQAPTPRTLRLDLLDASVDVTAFDAAVRNEEIPSLDLAIALYSGPLLEGCDEEWVFAERKEREQSYLQALEKRAHRALDQHAASEAVPFLRLLIQCDSLRESAHRLLLRAYADAGDIAAMTQAYRDLRILLHQEVGGDPSPETVALYTELKARARERGERQPTAMERMRAALQAPPESVSPAEPLPAPIPPFTVRIPHSLTSLIGRDALVGATVQRLQSARLVTLVGMGGVGKTRTAFQVARTLAERQREDIWVVELANLSPESPVAAAVARALDLPAVANRSDEEALISHFSDRPALLVLDNCEHVLDSCAALASHLLASCQSLRLLTTSRQALGIVGEGITPVPPLEAPPVLSTSEVQAVGKDLVSYWMEYASVRLFVERSQAVSPSFRLTVQNAETIGAICRRLDGIPLAIELAAARVRSLSVEQILHLLDDRFRLLTGGSRAALPRQQTLQALLDWSYTLLSVEEQELLGRLSVFAGGWTLESAEWVCRREVASGSPDPDLMRALQPDSASAALFAVLDPLTSLVDKSLVEYEEKSGVGRYRLQETVRQYGQDRLRESGAAKAIFRNHQAFFLVLVHEAWRHFRGADQARWMDRLEAEHDNLIAALDWSRSEPGELLPGLEMANRLNIFWRQRGYWHVGRRQYAAFLAHPEAQSPTFARAEALTIAGGFAESQGDFDEALALLQESLALQDELKNWEAAGSTLSSLAHIAYERSDLDSAVGYCTRALDIARAAGNRTAVAGHLNNLGSITSARGRYPEAIVYFEEALQINRAIGNRQWEGINLDNLGNAVLRQGDIRKAIGFHEQALEIHRSLGSRDGQALSLTNLGSANLRVGDYAMAHSFVRQALSIQQELGNWPSVSKSLYSLGLIAMGIGDYPTARSHFLEALDLDRDLGRSSTVAYNLCALGSVALLVGNLEEATACQVESLQIRRDLNLVTDVGHSLMAFAALAMARAQPERAARLYGAASASLATGSGGDMDVLEAPHTGRFSLPEVQQTLGEARCAEVVESGRAMSLSEAIAYALEEPG